MSKFKGLTKEQDRKICKLVEKQMKEFLKTLDERNFDIEDLTSLFLEFNTRTGKFCRSFEIKGSDYRFYLREDFKGYGSNKISDDDLEAVSVIHISDFVGGIEFFNVYQQNYESFQMMIKNFDKISMGYIDNIYPVYNQIIKSNKNAFKRKRTEKSKVA